MMRATMPCRDPHFRSFARACRVAFFGATLLFPFSAFAARDAAFLAPSSGFSGRTDEAVGVEPKNEIDLGETALNTARRVTVFFVNYTVEPIEILNITANGDANIRAEIVADDCTKLGSIASNSRCSVSVETTPVASGPWTAELLMTHKGAGRLARAKFLGKTSGSVKVESKETGLELSSQNVKPVEFGDVDVGPDRAVRTALMVNDSNDPISILSVEVIAPENGLERLEQGCAAGDELKPGESCPVTLVWKPLAKGIVSTDLIIRHSGKRGFTVVPVRGTAKGPEAPAGGADGRLADGRLADGRASDRGIPLSPTTEELERMIASGQVPPLSGSALSSSMRDMGGVETIPDIHLIGTIGNRAVFYRDDGSTFVSALGDDIFIGGRTGKLMNVMARQAEIYLEGRKKIFVLEPAAPLTARAAQRARESAKERSAPEDRNDTATGAAGSP